MDNEKRLRREIANSNERRRMQSINAGFQSLKTLIPHHREEKLSKVMHPQQTCRDIGQCGRCFWQRANYNRLRRGQWIVVVPTPSLLRIWRGCFGWQPLWPVTLFRAVGAEWARLAGHIPYVVHLLVRAPISRDAVSTESTQIRDGSSGLSVAYWPTDSLQAVLSITLLYWPQLTDDVQPYVAYTLALAICTVIVN